MSFSVPTLQQHRTAFIAQVAREVPHVDEQKRFTQALDHFINWSVQRASKLALYSGAARPYIVSFERIADGAILWSVYPRDHGARFEILPRGRSGLTAERMADVLNVISSVTVETVGDEDALRIPFAALKNPASRDRVTELLERILADPCPTVVRKPARTKTAENVAVV